MSVERLGHDLAALGLAGRGVRCLLFLPQIYVGWTIERRDVGALEALLETTASRGQFARASVDAARAWLFEAPTRRQYQGGFALLRALRRMAGASIRVSDVTESMLWAMRVADLERESLPPGRGRADTASRRALLDLEAWLEVAADDLWMHVFAGIEESTTEIDSPQHIRPSRAFRLQGSESPRPRKTLGLSPKAQPSPQSFGSVRSA